jgi:signal transduction histidine kinase
MASTIAERVRRLWLDLPLAVKGNSILAVPVLCLFVEIAWLAYVHRAEESAAGWTLHTQQVQLEANKLLTLLLDAETAGRGYVITRNTDFLAPLTLAQAQAPQTVARLKILVADNRAQGERLRMIEQLANEKLSNATAIIGASQNSREQIGVRIERGKQVMDSLRVVLNNFLGEENRLLEERSRQLESRRASTVWVLWTGVVLAVISGAAANRLFSRGICERLLVIARQGNALAEGRPLAPAGGAQDEIGKLEQNLQRAYAVIGERNESLAKSEHALKKRAVELEAANQDLEAFSYSVSHDLRAPLRHIDGFSKILLEDFGGEMKPDARRLIERVRQGTCQMGKLIDELLTLGRIGRRPLVLYPVPLRTIAEASIEELRAETEGRNIVWQIGQLPTVECDPGLIQQVFLNLLSNAVKYTRGREPAVISIGEERSNGSRAIYVRDNGVGFNMLYADKLFGLFQRLHRQEDFEGTGVGLATVARIVHRHSGRVWAQAELDRGATFYFQLGEGNGRADAVTTAERREV